MKLRSFAGTVSKVKLLYDRDTNASRGMAFVDFEETEATDKAVKMTDKEIKGKAIFVKYNTPREAKGKGEKGAHGGTLRGPNARGQRSQASRARRIGSSLAI